MFDERSRKVLRAIVQSYIENPDPVGSRYVTKKYEFGVSPATIRNIMADLEDMGYLMQPHTSAGRVPTDLGYRFFVEALLSERTSECLSFSDEIYSRLKHISDDLDGLLRETTKVISSFSHYLAVASLPTIRNSVFHKIEFISYKDDQIVIVLFTDEGLIRHKVVKNDLALKRSDLQRVVSYLNSRFRGVSVSDVRKQLVEEMKHQKDDFDFLISKAMEMCCSSLPPTGENVFISGLKEVVNLPDFADVEKIKELSGAIEDKHTIIKLLDRIIDGEEEGVHVVIGSENSSKNLRDLSMVASTYKECGMSVGVVGIIGPTRMDYRNAIAAVSAAATFISGVLTGDGLED